MLPRACWACSRKPPYRAATVGWDSFLAPPILEQDIRRPRSPPRSAKCKLSIMVFAKRLREGVRRSEITCSVRIWTRPHVKVGNRYRMEEGEIEVDSITPIGFPDITPP